MDTIGFSKQLAEKMKVYDAAAAKAPINLARAKKEIINEFIVSALVTEYAAKNGISVSELELETEFNKLRKGYASDIDFKESLAQSGLLIEEWKAKLKVSLLQKKVIDDISKSVNLSKQIQNNDVKNYYESHLREFQRPAEIRISQIVVQHMDEADELKKRIKSGSFRFEEAAKKFSLSPDGKKGGDIGFLAKGVVPAFDIAFTFPVGQLSSVIKSSYGYHLMKVTEKRAASKQSLEQARPSILKLVMEQKKEESFRQWFDQQIKLAKLEEDTPLIDALKVYTQGNLE